MKKLYSLLLLTFIGILSSYGQTVDDTFVQPLAYKAAKITQIKELSDGKILVSGDIAFYGNTPVNNLIRLNADYSLDQTFLFTNPNNLKIKKVDIQSNGNIIVVANVDNPWGGANEQATIFQLNPNGEVITTITNLIDVSGIAIQADDKILVSVGNISVDNGHLYRYNSDLTIDDDFNNDISFDKSVSDVKVFGSSIYASGLFTIVDGTNRNSLVKLNSDGTVDTTFDAGQGSNGSGFSMTIQDDGKILIGGNFFNMNENVSTTSILRLNPDGSLDSNFVSPYYSAGSSQIAVKDSYIYVSAQVNDGTTITNYLLKLKSDGTLDENFTPVKLKELGNQFFVLGFANNKVLCNNVDNSINKYGLAASNLDGSPFDSSVLKPASYGTFDKGGYFNGKLIVKGDFVRINDVETFGIGMLDETGTVDENFVFKNYLGDIRQFQIIDNSTVFVSTKDLFLKLDNQGNITKIFDYKTDTQLTRIEQFQVLENGKILITDQSGLFLLNENGVQESVFTINSDPDYWVTGVHFEMQNDKIICRALIANFSSTIYIPKLIRFNLDTSLDTNFNIGQAPDANIEKIVVLNSGEIIAAGGFLTFNGISVPNQIVKLSADGIMDLQFNQNLSAYQIGYAQMHDYKKIEELDSVLYITEGDSKVTAINLDGTLVNDFAMPVTINQVNDLVALEEPAVDNSETSKKSKSDTNTESDTNYMYAFGTVNNPSNGVSSVIVKVNLGKKSGSLGLDPITGVKSVSNVQLFPVPVQEKMNVSFSNSIVPTKVAVYSLSGSELYTAKVQTADDINIDMSGFNPGIYFIKVFSESGVTTKKIIKK